MTAIATVTSATGLGARGSAGMAAGSLSIGGTIELRFDHREWEQPAAQSGQITLGLAGLALARVWPIGGWAAVTIAGPPGSTVLWAAPARPGPGSTAAIGYEAV